MEANTAQKVMRKGSGASAKLQTCNTNNAVLLVILHIRRRYLMITVMNR